MGQKLGVIAGAGVFPIHVCREARRSGQDCVVAGIRGEADSSLSGSEAEFQLFDVHEIENLITFFKKNQVSEAVFAGKIDHRIIFKNEGLRRLLPVMLGQRKDWTPTNLIQKAIQILAAQGIAVVDPTPYIASAFCEEGILSKTNPSPEIREDIRFGWDIAKRLADLDVGQTVIIKDKAVVAVEGMEGTDNAILRAGDLAGKGIVVVKVSRSSQDPRIDLPAVGLKTIESLMQGEGAALAIEAKKIPFFQKEEAIPLADSHGISLIAK